MASGIKAAYWFPDSGFRMESIDSSFFTHLFCAFADVDPTTFKATIQSGFVAQFASFTGIVQRRNPTVKTLLSIGGDGEIAKQSFAAMAGQPGRRRTFIQSSIVLARNNGFNGLDIDWEYPTNQAQMSNFAALLTEFRVAVIDEARVSSRTPLLLTAATFRSNYIHYLDVRYPIREMLESLDFINVMTYDIYGPGWSAAETDAPAGLFPSAPNKANANAGITDWIRAGIPAKKLVLGLPFYGYAWRLTNANNHGFSAPANGPVPPRSGDVTYSEIKTNHTAATFVYDAAVVSDYCYFGTTWIGFDGVKSIMAKVRYAKEKGLGGYFAWHVGGDFNSELSRTALQAWG